MPTFEITSPDGRTYQVTAPEGATQDQVMAFAQQNYQAKPPKIDVASDAISQGALNFAKDGSSDALGGISQGVLNALGGLVRGAGSIGATIARPFESGQENDQRRTRIDENMASVGAKPDSFAYGAGKLGGELAGTAGVGGLVAKPLQALSALTARAGAGSLPTVDAIATALQTGGFRTGGLSGLAGVNARLGAGGVVGAGAAGLVNPEDAGTGALIGAGLPGASALGGKLFETLGSAVRPMSKASAETLNTARNSMDAGYLIPPSMIDPSYTNRAIEGLSGKFATAQMASTKNQTVTDSLIRKSIGLAPDAPLTQEGMDIFRAQQYQAGYEPVKQLGAIPASQKFNDALDNIVKQYTGKGTIPAMARDDIKALAAAHKTAGFDAGDAVDAIRILRDEASSSFTKGDGAMGKAYKSIANAYESAIEDALKGTGQQDLLAGYRDARTNIAKSFTIDKGLREGAGTVDARAIARELQKGKPLTGDLRTVAEFGNTFNKAAQPPHLIGSPDVNVLKPMMSLMTGGLGGLAMGPAGMALGAANYVLPPAARAYMFSPGFQRGLLDMAPAANDELGLLTQAAYRAAPLLSGQ